MNCKIVEVNPPAPAKPRTWTREELENGTAPEGLYRDNRGGECVLLVCTSILDTRLNALTAATGVLGYGPFTHVGTVDVTLHLDRSKAVR
jgi:hypothetical protein